MRLASHHLLVLPGQNTIDIPAGIVSEILEQYSLDLVICFLLLVHSVQQQGLHGVDFYMIRINTPIANAGEERMVHLPGWVG